MYGGPYLPRSQKFRNNGRDKPLLSDSAGQDKNVGALGFERLRQIWPDPQNALKFASLLEGYRQWSIEQKKLREQIERGDLIIISDSSQISLEVRP